jgi:hypothetical protein
MWRLVIVVMFNAGVAIAFYALGATLSVSWFTFLGLMVFASVGEVELRIFQFEIRLAEFQGEAQVWFDTISEMARQIDRIEGKMDAISERK